MPAPRPPHLQSRLPRGIDEREQRSILVPLTAAAPCPVAEALQAAGGPGVRRKWQVVQHGGQRAAGQAHKGATTQRGQQGAGNGVQHGAGLQLLGCDGRRQVQTGSTK